MKARHAGNHARGSRLPPLERKLTYVAFVLAWLSGAAWLVFHYFLQRQGEFALEPHPLEHWCLRLHGLTAFVLLWLGGVLWVRHVQPGMRWPPRRTSGLTIACAFCVMAASGYLLYYADEGATRDAIGLVHWIIGLALILPMLLHALPSYRRRSIDG